MPVSKGFFPESFLAQGKTLVSCGPKQTDSSETNSPSEVQVSPSQDKHPMQPAVDSMEEAMREMRERALARQASTTQESKEGS